MIGLEMKHLRVNWVTISILLCVLQFGACFNTFSQQKYRTFSSELRSHKLRHQNLLSRTCPASMTLDTKGKSERLSKRQFLALQNGSDVRGVSVAHDRPVTLGTHEATALGRAYARWLSLQKLRHWDEKRKDEEDKKPLDHLRVSVGMDPRITSKSLSEAFCQGLMAEGAEVNHFGLASTPAMFKSCVTPGFDFDAGVMVTASHLPFDRNGLKFFTKEGGMDKRKLREVMDIGAEIYDKEHNEVMFSTLKPKKMDFLKVYKEQLSSKIREDLNSSEDYEQPLKGFRILVNAGNGAGGFFVDILEKLGAETQGSLHLEPDGMFPNHSPNPESPEAMEATIAAVKEHEADLGVVFDTDVDRCGLVDGSGTVINRNRLIALVASIILRANEGSTIVTDSVTSNGLKSFIENLGGKHLRYMKGYKNVIDKSIELNQQGIRSDMAIETSGHCAFKENQFLDDGAYLIVKVIIEMAKLHKAGAKLTDLIADLQEPAESYEFRFTAFPEFEEMTTDLTSSFAENLEKLSNNVEEWDAEQTNYEGFRVSVDEGDGKFGWVMVRQSLHEPIVVCNVESETVGGLKIIGEKLLSGFLLDMKDKLDLSPLIDHCSSKS